MVLRIARAPFFLLAVMVCITKISWAQTEDELLWQKLDIAQDGWLDGKELGIGF